MSTAPPQWAPPQWAPAPPTERLAVASLVVALVTPFGFPIVGVAAGAVAASIGTGFFEFGAFVSLLSLALGSLTAVVLGHVARSRCRRDGTGGAGLAVAGLAIGYCSLALTMVFATAYALPGATSSSYSFTSSGETTFAIPSAAPPLLPVQPAPEPGVVGTDRGVLLGRVTDDTGTPVAGATVTVVRAEPTDRSDVPTCPLSLTASTGPDGRWFLPVCQLGQGLGYDVAVTSAGRRAFQDAVYVDAGTSTLVDLQLPALR